MWIYVTRFKKGVGKIYIYTYIYIECRRVVQFRPIVYIKIV